MQGQITVTAGLALLQLLVQFLGTRKTGMTGEQKKQTVVDIVAPLLPLAAGIAANNTNDPVHKAEIAVLAQGFHDTLQAGGLIRDTATLEAGTAAAVPTVLPLTEKQLEANATAPTDHSTGNVGEASTP